MWDVIIKICEITAFSVISIGIALLIIFVAFKLLKGDED